MKITVMIIFIKMIITVEVEVVVVDNEQKERKGKSIEVDRCIWDVRFQIYRRKWDFFKYVAFPNNINNVCKVNGL